MEKKKGRATEVEVRPWEKNLEMTAVLLAALEENPVSKELTPDQRLEVVDLALLEKRFHDTVWLAEAVLNVKMQGISGKKHTEIPVSRPILVSSQEEWLAVLEAHRAWIGQVLQPAEPLGPGRANLKGNDLRAFSLDGVDLRSANLEGCDLRGCSLLAANLSGCNLAHANLEGAILHKAKLRRARLCNANLSQVKAHGTDLRQIQADQALWTGADLRELRFDETLPKKARETMDAIHQTDSGNQDEIKET